MGELAETLAEISRDSRLDREPTDCWLDLAETVCYLDRALEAGHRALATFTLSQSAPRVRCPDCDVHVDPFVHQCGRSDLYHA